MGVQGCVSMGVHISRDGSARVTFKGVQEDPPGRWENGRGQWRWREYGGDDEACCGYHPSSGGVSSGGGGR